MEPSMLLISEIEEEEQHLLLADHTPPFGIIVRCGRPSTTSPSLSKNEDHHHHDGRWICWACRSSPSTAVGHNDIKDHCATPGHQRRLRELCSTTNHVWSLWSLHSTMMIMMIAKEEEDEEGSCGKARAVDGPGFPFLHSMV
jgi:hypothetical protein